MRPRKSTTPKDPTKKNHQAPAPLASEPDVLRCVRFEAAPSPPLDDHPFWSAKIGRPVTPAELSEIDNNFIPFIELLVSLRDRQLASESGASATQAEVR